MAAVSLTTPLRQRDFRLLWSGMAVSLLGDGIFLVAVAWQAYALSDRPSALAFVGIATSLPQVAMLLFGGAVSDRFRRQSVLFWADAARAVAVGGLAVATASGSPHLWQLYLTGALIGTATAFASPSFDALIPQLVPEDQLTQANAFEQFVRPATIQLAGPALGGLAVALVHTAGALAIDAATFVYSAACVLRMSRRAPAPSEGPARLRQEVLVGLRYVRSHVWLWGTFVSATFTYLLIIGPSEVLLPYIVRDLLHRGASAYGIVLAAGGVGALIGAVLMGTRRERRRPMMWIYGWWTLATLGVAGYGVATGMGELVLAALVVNGAEVAGAVAWATLKQRQVPNSMMGRVSSIDWFVSTALLPLSYAVTAPVAHLLGVRTTLVVAGATGSLLTLGFLFLPGMREHDAARRVHARHHRRAARHGRPDPSGGVPVTGTTRLPDHPSRRSPVPAEGRAP